MDGLWTPRRFSTAFGSTGPGLWEAGDGGGSAEPPLTWGDARFSTIHSTYYCS